MRSIDIINGSTSDETLTFEVDGNPNNGNTSAKKSWNVRWKVRAGIDNPVDKIVAIKMKGAPSSTDIFSGDGEQPEGHENGRHWKAKVKSDAANHAQYHYEIHWMAKGDINVKIHDPLISIMPTKDLDHILEFIKKYGWIILVGGTVALLFSKKRRMKVKRK